MSADLHIGVVAARAGMSPGAVRYLEHLGLVRHARRTRGGFRLFRGDDVPRLRLIAGMQALDMPAPDIAEVLAARERLQAARDHSERERARSELRRHADRAAHRCRELRRALSSAEATAAALTAEAGDASPEPRRSRR